MNQPELPSKRTQRIIQPISDDLSSTTVQTVKTDAQTIYPTASTDIAGMTAAGRTAPAQPPATQDMPKGTLTPEQQQIYDDYVARQPIKKSRAPKWVEVTLTILSIVLLATATLGIANTLLSMMFGFTTILDSTALIPALIFGGLFLLLAVYFFQRREIARLLIRVLLFISLLSAVLVVLSNVSILFRIGFSAPEIIPYYFMPLIYAIVPGFVFVFLGRRDVKALFN